MKAIFGEKWSHPSTWPAFCSNVRKGKIFKCFFFFSCVEGRGKRGRQRGERMEEDKTGEVTHMEATRKKREQDGWWVERIQSE